MSERCPKCGATIDQGAGHRHRPGSGRCLRNQLAQAQERESELTEEFIKQNRDLSEVILHNAQLWRVLEDALSFVRTVRDAPEKTHDWMRANGIVLNDLDDRMQKTAFSVYTDLVSLSNQARELLDDIYEEALSSSPANPYAAAVSAIKREAAHDFESLVACTIYSMAEKALALLDGEKGGGGA